MSPALSKEEQPGVFGEDAGPQKYSVVQKCMEAPHAGEASTDLHKLLVCPDLWIPQIKTFAFSVI